MIPEVSMGATEAGDNALIVHTVTEWVTLEIGVISYMVVLYALLIWPSLLYRLRLRFRVRALYFRLKESLLRPMNMRKIFASLKQLDQPSLLLLPRPVLSLPISHTLPLLVLGSSIMVHLIISLVIRISSLRLLSFSPYL